MSGEAVGACGCVFAYFEKCVFGFYGAGGLNVDCGLFAVAYCFAVLGPAVEAVGDPEVGAYWRGGERVDSWG